jgi:hypothetical protein
VPYPRHIRKPGNAYGRRRDAGHERALQHVREGNQLSTLLGGTDQAVKSYLFGLPKEELKQVLADYGREHGIVAMQYAESTLPKWRTGRVSMSGMVAERLYRLLPPRMPLTAKYEIAEELWRHVGPRSSKVVRFGKNASHAEIVRTVEDYISAVVREYQIPESLQTRFNWLASNDVKVKQLLLNKLRNKDKRVVVESASLQASSMLNHLSSEQAGFTHLYAHTAQLGNHQLKLVADKDLDGCRVEDDVSSRYTPDGYLWFWVLVGAVILFFVLRSFLGA